MAELAYIDLLGQLAGDRAAERLGGRQGPTGQSPGVGGWPSGVLPQQHMQRAQSNLQHHSEHLVSRRAHLTLLRG